MGDSDLMGALSTIFDSFATHCLGHPTSGGWPTQVPLAHETNRRQDPPIRSHKVGGVLPHHATHERDRFPYERVVGLPRTPRPPLGGCHAGHFLVRDTPGVVRRHHAAPLGGTRP